MVDGTVPSVFPRRARPSWWRRLCAPLLLVLLLAGLAGWRAPRPFRLVGVYPCGPAYTLIPLTTGFLYFADEDTLLQRGPTGAVNWRVTLPPNTDGWGPTPSEFAVSPDGHLCVTLEPRAGIARLRLYREGTRIAVHDLRLPTRLRDPHNVNLKLLNDGRAFLTIEMATDALLFVVTEAALLGSGRIAKFCVFTPDGTLAVSAGRVTNIIPIHIANGAVRMSRSVPISASLDLNEYLYNGSDRYSALYAPHTIMEADGTIHLPTGKTLNRLGEDWRNTGIISPNSRYTAFENGAGTSRFYDPTTGDGWSTRWDVGVHTYDVTDDGRFVLLHRSMALPPLVESLCSLLGIRQPCLYATYFLIYERPGILRAAYRNRDNVVSWWFSADGRTLALKEANARIRLLRW
ncbi:MAG TPA: hypothetical protein PK794_06030 [Armatimonadota bacterium]|nr:hypothetical protein [Armatimonadota bacterium]